MKTAIIASLLLLLSSILSAGELYLVQVSDFHEAEVLSSTGAEAIFRMGNAYLVLYDDDQAKAAIKTIAETELIASAISRSEIAIDVLRDPSLSEEFTRLYEKSNIRFVRVAAEMVRKAAVPGLIPLPDRAIAIEYTPPSLYSGAFAPDTLGLDTLIDRISQDSLESYLYRLEAFYRRLTGTDSCYAAADWIASKFAEFGYDSIVVDTFTGSQIGNGYVESRNVIATKVGSRFPNRVIVVGGHFDAVPNCPGVDDNGTGTAGVMEIARVLKDIETVMTFKFIAFDSEESWMWGSYDYADSVAALGEDIIYMQNLDMIGHLPNTTQANLYYGVETAYAELWINLAYPLVGIQGILNGHTASDHLPFLDNGYDAIFVQERIFSSNYHMPSDSTTYIDFDYMTRMVKASLATNFIVNTSLPPVNLTGLYDVGDGQSLMLEWAPSVPGEADYYVIYYGIHPDIFADSITVPFDSSSYIITGLTEDIEYTFTVAPRANDGRMVIKLNTISGTPFSLPALPQSLLARPMVGGIRLEWVGDNDELDFSHYQVIRDQALLPDTINYFFYEDTDPALGGDWHAYIVVAVDTDGNMSDTTGAVPVMTKAATLEQGRILALNRTSSVPRAMIIESVSGEVMRAALEGFDYDYFSDTSAYNPNRANLYDLINYELVMVSAEGGRGDEIMGYPLYDDLERYFGIGGKLILFSRRGDVTGYLDDIDTVHYSPGIEGTLYFTSFQTAALVKPKSYFNYDAQALESDFVGAHSVQPGYPDLTWDSVAVAQHTDWSAVTVTGIPCPGIPLLWGSGMDTVYTYDSATDSALTEGRVIGWRKPDRFVYFEIPLSLMERTAAVAALRQAVTDMGLVVSVDDEYSASVPMRFELSQNYPNPFNPETVIEFFNPESRSIDVSVEVFNVLGQRVRTLVDGPVGPGRHRVVWDGRDDTGDRVATGIYLYRLKTDTDVVTRKMLLLK